MSHARPPEGANSLSEGQGRRPMGAPMTMTATAPLAASLDEAIALADSAATVREAALLLRERYAPLKVVVVDAFDMREEKPAAEGAKRVLWGAASDGHCWQVTADLGSVAGLYLADKG